MQHSYTALTATAGVVELASRTQIEVTGADRAAFLHNMSTNDIRGLKPGSGCEAFLTNSQGRILAHVFVFCEDESLCLDTVPGQGESILQHLDRYIIREDVRLAEQTADWSQWLLAGATSAEVLAACAGAQEPHLPAGRLAHRTASVAGHQVSLRRVDLAGPDSLLVRCATGASAAVGQALLDAGAVRCVSEAFEAVRIEAGMPFYGRDITEKNLPQEVARDALAISFTKGCYIGQETVARIDALGHVNQTLVGVRFHGQQIPAAGDELRVEARPAGRVTSATFSPALDAPLALAYVRRGKNQPGSMLESNSGAAEVVRLPVEAPGR